MEEREKRDQQVAVVVVVDWVACLIARLPPAAWAPSTVTSSCSCYSSFLHSSHSSGRLDRDSSKTAAVDTNNTLRSSATVKATTTATTTATLPSQTSTSTPLPPPLSLPPLTICQPQAPTPPYQRLTKALQCDPRCGHEVSERGRVRELRYDSSCGQHFKCATRRVKKGVDGGGEAHSCWGGVCMLSSDVTAQGRNRQKKVCV